ncbi:MAG: hypothetical protein QOF30_2321 [Acidimicrobiaceae bacterium]|jgi:hypothetical protein|nr:hypothetical protein [Acidimicrobiaceae bacterium]
MLLAAMAFGACAGGVPKQRPAAATSATAHPGGAVTTATNSSVADRTAATAALFKASDLPNNWQSTPRHHSTSNQERIAAQLIACDHDSSKVHWSATTESPDFTTPNGVTLARNDVDVGSTTSDAEQLLVYAQRPEWPTCLNAAITPQYENTFPDAKVTGSTTSALKAPAVLDKIVATRTTVTFNAPSGTISLYADFVILQYHRFIATLFFRDIITPFDTGLQQQLITTVANRIKAAAAG